MALAPLFEPAEALQTAVDAPAWRGVASAVGAAAYRPARLQPVRASKWRLQVLPMYAALKNGRPSHEDESPWARQINAAIASGDSARIDGLFGRGRPVFAVSWTFEATNAVTGERTPVKVNKDASASEVHVDLAPTAFANAFATIRFPTEPAGAVFRLRATAAVTDSFGNSVKAEQLLWSHLLPVATDDEIETLLQTVAHLAGISARQLLFESRIRDLPSPDADPTISDPRLRRARTLRTFATTAAVDGRITIGELEILGRGARK